MEEIRYLVKWYGNWADEFDYEGFEIVTYTQREEIIERLKNSDREEFNLGLGTNEDDDWDKEDIIDTFESADELTPEQYDVISKLFGESFGFTFYDTILWQLDDDDC